MVEASGVFLEIGVLVFFVLIGGVMAARFRQPTAIGLLFAGALIGPHWLGLIKQNDVISTFAEIGAVLLLFAIGTEFSISKLAKMGTKTIFVAIMKLSIVFFLTYQVARLFSLSSIASMYIGAIMAITSTALTIKVLEANGFMSKQEVPILIGALILEDIVAVLAIAFFSSVSASGQIQLVNVGLSLLKALAIMGFIYIIISHALEKALEDLLKYSTEDVMPLIALSLGMAMAFIASYIGLTSSIGAFLAGSMIAGLRKGEIIEKAIKPFALTFSSLFFFSIGLTVNINTILPFLPLIIVLLIASLIGKLFGTALSVYLIGRDGRGAIFSGLAMLSVGEFSLIIAREGANVVPFDIVGITSALVFLTAIISAIAVTKTNQVYRLLEDNVPLSWKTHYRRWANMMKGIIVSVEVGTNAFQKLGELLKSLFFKGGALLMLVSLILIAAGYSQHQILGLSVQVLALVGIVAVIALIIPTIGTIQDLSKIIDFITELIMKSRKMTYYSHRRRIARDMVSALFLILLAFNLPIILSLLKLPNEAQFLSIILIIVALIQLYDIGKAIKG